MFTLTNACRCLLKHFNVPSSECNQRSLFKPQKMCLIYKGVRRMRCISIAMLFLYFNRFKTVFFSVVK